MHGRAKHSTNPPTPPADLPEPTGPTDERVVYHLMPKAVRLLAEAQAAAGDGDDAAPLFRPADRVSAVSEALREEDRRQRRQRLAREASRRGRRLGTVSALQRNGEERPYVRLSGKWLGEAGFDLGEHFEIEVGEGRLTLETV
jgi:hypothetical protein